jgi:hypothetical protein
MRGFLVGLSVSAAFIVGCVAGASNLGVPRAQASYVEEQRWAYFCFDANSVDDIQYKANAAGMRGWEMVTSLENKDGDAVWCFRQPRP